MKTLDQRILELLKKYMEKLKHKKVLTSREEIEANTNETNLVAAPVVAELYRNISHYMYSNCMRPLNGCRCHMFQIRLLDLM